MAANFLQIKVCADLAVLGRFWDESYRMLSISSLLQIQQIL